MKKKHNEGFTLVELLVSIVILAAIVLPTCTSLVLSYRLNAKTEAMMQAQLAVSSAVETLMAEGITDEFVASLKPADEANESIAENAELETGETKNGVSDRFPGLTFTLTNMGDYYDVTISDDQGLAPVTTQIHKGGA